jgi:hypothetical protein
MVTAAGADVSWIYLESFSSLVCTTVYAHGSPHIVTVSLYMFYLRLLTHLRHF